MGFIYRILIVAGMMLSLSSPTDASAVVRHERTAYTNPQQTEQAGSAPYVSDHVTDMEISHAERRPAMTPEASSQQFPEDNPFRMHVTGSPTVEELLREIEGDILPARKENPYLQRGQIKGIPFYDSVYRVSEPGKEQNKWAIVVRQQATANLQSAARYYSFIVIEDSSAEHVIFTKESLPCLSLENADGYQEISFPRAWRIFPRAVMLQMKRDTLEAAYEAKQVVLVIDRQDGEMTWIPIPEEVLEQWKMVMRAKLGA